MSNKEEIPVKRDLDGIYFRVLRNGRWVDRCFSDLTHEEQDQKIKLYSVDGLRTMVLHLADCLAQLGEAFNIVSTEADDE